MTAKAPSRTADQFVLRLPDGMRPRIAESAKANGRSMNAEIVARLEASFSPLSLQVPSNEKLEAMFSEAFLKMIESGTLMEAVNKALLDRNLALANEAINKNE